MAKIIRVADSRRFKAPGGTRRVKASGKYLIPGLWDMHVHLFNNATRASTNDSATAFPLMIANGVTGVRDMWADTADRTLIKYWRGQIDAGRMVGPRIVHGSRILDGSPVTWTNSAPIGDPAEAVAMVRSEKSSGAGFIKVYDRLSRSSFLAVAQEAKRLNIPFAGHVPLSVTALEASTAGQASVEHLTDMLETCSGSEAQLRALPEGRARALLSASGFDGAKCRSAGRRFKQNGTAHTPTLVMHRGRLIEPFARDADPRLQSATTAERQAWETADARMRGRDYKVMSDMFATQLKVVAEMASGGTLILAGTDLGNPHIYAGSSLHDELALMVRAGMSPQAALATATTNPVTFLGLQTQSGSIAAGKMADLVLLEGDPLTDIANTKRIAAVVSNGLYLDASRLSEMKRQAALAAPPSP